MSHLKAVRDPVGEGFPVRPSFRRPLHPAYRGEQTVRVVHQGHPIGRRGAAMRACPRIRRPGVKAAPVQAVA